MPPRRSNSHQSELWLPPSTWWAAVAQPQRNPSGKRRSPGTELRRCRREARPAAGRASLRQRLSSVPGERRFPDGVLWGCATAAHQVEGGNHNSDWWEFERRGGIHTGDSADPACDQYRRFREDFALLGRLHNNAHRLSIEWSRVEPAPGRFDRAQIEHYRE